MMLAGSKLGLWKALVALSLVMVPLLGGLPRVSAQDTGLVDDTTYVLELNGDEVAWDAPWEYAEDLNSVNLDEGSESLGFTSGGQVQSVLYLPTGIDLKEARDSFLEAFAGEDVELQTIDRGAYSNVSYSLDLAMLSDTLFGLFTVYIDDNDYVHSYATLAPADELGDAVDSAKDQITINGDPIYTGVEGSGLQDLVDANAADFAPTDVVPGKDTDASSTDADAAAYLGTVRNNYDELADSVDRFDELLGGGQLTDDDVQELAGINDLWLGAPDAAAELEAPADYDEIQSTYEDYAGSLADAGAAFNDLIQAEQGSNAATRASDDLTSALNDADDAGADLDDLLTTAEDDLAGASSQNDDNGSAKNDQSAADADAEEYLQTVRDNFDELNDSVGRFTDLLGSGNLSDADVDELTGILDLWLGASDVAAKLDAPAEYADIQSTYEDYTSSLADAGTAFVTLLGADQGSAAASQASDDLSAALDDASSSGADLDELLTEAGV